MTKTCQAAGCEAIKILARSLCTKHYKRWYRYGDLNARKAANGDRKKHPLYSTYTNMKTRCYNKSNLAYKDYGARGIEVCDRWLGVEGFDNFCKDMGDKPSGYSLERSNNASGYSPDNCIWADKFQQAANERDQRNNTSGKKGVWRRGTSWAAYITRKGVRHYLGTFSNIDDAIAARLSAEARL